MTSGLYIHIPFCSALCHYCDFAVVVGKTDLHARYCDALVDEAARARWGAMAGTVFIGGGTPSFIDPTLLASTLARIAQVVPFARDAEVSIEANPESVVLDGMKMLIDAGVNRVSIGAQSFDDAVLRGLTRTHSASDVGRAVDVARAAGCVNVSLDLIYGGPGETDDSWEHSLRAAVALGVEHISCYALTIEERTPFGKAVATHRMRAPDDDALADRYERAHDVLGEAGFVQYELSNWAKPGSECRHNLVYWNQGDYLGLGLGAHSHRAGTRWWNTRSITDYLAGARRVGEEILNDREQADEWVSLQMRLSDGLDLRDPRAEGLDPAPLVAAGLATIEGQTLRLTLRGMLLENRATGMLLDSRRVVPRP